MEEVNSDSDLSADSLEGLCAYLSKINTNEAEKMCLESTKCENSGNSYKSFRDKEALGEKTKVESMKTSTDSSITLSGGSGNSNLCDKREVSSNVSDKHNGGSYFLSDAPRSQSARIPSIRRVSRRQSVCFESSESQRIRHRSVSYLEQFKRKHGGTTNDDFGSTTLTTFPSEVTSLSCVSGTTITSEKKTVSSEFEFCEEFTTSARSNVLNRTRTENNSNYKVITADRKGVPKPKKGHPIIHGSKQPKCDLRKCDQDDFDKRKAIEKREEYSKKVQLRNQIKANRQKEIDKATKFKKLPFKSHPCEEEYFLHRRWEHNSPLNSNEIDAVPFLMNQLKLPAPPSLDYCTRKTQAKPVKRKTKVKPQKSGTEECKLSMLQKRHASEKTAVDSIRNSFTNR